jgi:hypothetical protein
MRTARRGKGRNCEYYRRLRIEPLEVRSLLSVALLPAGQAPAVPDTAASAPPASPHTPAVAASVQPADSPVAQDDSYTVKENQALDERSSVTQLDMVSQPGDPIGNGLTYSYNDSAYNFSVGEVSGGWFGSGVAISVTAPPPSPPPGGILVLNAGWQLIFAAPAGSVLAPGTYTGAQEYSAGSYFFPNPAGAPGIYVYGMGVALSTSTRLAGQFTVNDVQYDVSGNVLQFDASFEEHLGSATAALTGRIQYQEPQPASVSVLANDSSPDGNPLTAVLVAGPQDGTLTLASDGGFLYTPNAGFTGTDSFQYQASDGTNLSNTATVTLNVIPFHHAPVGTSATISVPAGPSYALKPADFGFSDLADSPPDTFTAVEITTLPPSGSLALSGNPVSAGQFIGVEDLAAGNLVFTPATGGPRGSFTFQVEDSGSTINGGANLDPLPKTLTIDFAPIAQDDSYSIDENQTLDEAFLGNHLRLTYTYPWSSQSYATDVDGSAQPPTVTMNGNGVTFTYPNAAYYSGSHTLQFAAAGNAPLAPGVYDDAQPTADAGHPGLSVDAAQLAFSAPTRQFTVIEAVYGPAGDIERFDATFDLQDPTTGYSLTGRIQYHASAILGTSVLANDSDEDGDPLSAVLVSGPQHGTLTFDRDGGFVYVPDQNYYGSDSFQYEANDGTANSNVATVTINVAHVSQAPLGTSTTLTPAPGVPYVLQVADFGFSDPNDSPPDAFTAVEITTLPTWGSLALGGVPVAAGQFIGVADIAAGNLVFTPSTDTARTSRDSFTFQVEDSGSTANGGANLDPVPKTLTFDVPPVAQDDFYSTNENQALSEWVVSNPGAVGVLQNDSDADGDPLSAILVTGPQHGSLTLFPSDGFVYTPDTDFYGTDTFQYQASDGTALSNVATVTITVVKVSQAPSGTSATVNIPPGEPYALTVADFGFSDVHDNPPDSFTAVEITTLPTAGGLTLGGGPVAAGQFVSVADLAAGNLLFTPAVLAPGSPHASFTFQVQDSGSTAGGGANLDPDPKTLTFNTIPLAQDDSYSVDENQVLDNSIDETRLQVAPVNAPYWEYQSFDFGPDEATFTARRNSWNGVDVDTSGAYYWYLTFGGWYGGAPEPGTYTNASPAPIYLSQTPYSPYLGVSGASWPIAGEDAGGSFTVNQAVYGPSGEVEQLDISFDQNASWAGPDLAGRLRFHASAPGAVSVLANDLDGDGDPLAPILVSGPSHGSLSLDPGGGFIYTPDTGFYGTDSFQYQASDGSAASNVATVTINVNRVSQPPSGTSSTVTLPPGTAYVIRPADFGFTDPHDNPPYDFTGVRIGGVSAYEGLTLSGTPVGFGQFVGIADITAGNLVFDMPAGGPRPWIDFQVEDDGSKANGGVTVDPNPKTLSFNIAPVAADDAYSVDENAKIDCTSSATAFWTNSQPGDPVGDGNGCSYTGATAEFSPEQVGRNGVSIEVYPYPGSGSWNIAFSAPAGADLAAGTYTGAVAVGEATGSQPGLSVWTARAGPLVTTGQFTVNQVVYDRYDDLVRFDATFTQYVNGCTAALTGEISYNSGCGPPAGVLLNDRDANGDPLTAVLVSGPQHGTLSLDPNGGFVYQPNQYFYGTDSFQYQASDGCALSNVATATIDVLQASQAPSGTSSLICVPAGVPYVLKPADFGFSDPHDSPPDKFIAVEITSLPQRGSLTLAGAAVTAGQFVSVKDLAAGRLAFQPPASCGNACGWRSYFYFQVEDSGSTANGGVVLDPNPKTLTFDVIPVAGNVAFSVDENTAITPSRYAASLTLTTTDISGNTVTQQFDQHNASFTATQGPLDAYWSALTVVCNTGGDQWTLNFGPCIGGPLWPGLFSEAVGWRTYNCPYISIYKNDAVPTWPEHVFGQFTVNSIVYGPAFEVLQFDATFQQQTEWQGSVTGHIHFQAASVLNSASDADGDGLTAILVSSTKHGSIALNANGTFTYTPNAYFSGTDSFQYEVNDGTATSNVATATITVNHVSQAPLGRDTTVVVAPGSNYSVKVADFGFSDPHDSPPDRFIAVEITSLPTRGSLTLAGRPVAAGQFVSVADVAAGRLVFHPAALPKGVTGRASLTFQVEDSGSTRRGGAVLDPAPKTLTFDTAPVAMPGSFTVKENATLNVPPVAGVLRDDTDADGDPLTAILVGGPQHGTLSLAANGGFVYTPNVNFFGWDSFQYVAGDGTAESGVATVSLYVRPTTGPTPGTEKGGTHAAAAPKTAAAGAPAAKRLSLAPSNPFTAVKAPI